jgi:hypothetical protein
VSPFEITMLILFGASWPISIAKAFRTKRVEGKSPLFMMVICTGYLFGILHKIHYARDWVIVLYALNMLMILVDLSLYLRYLPRRTSRGSADARASSCPDTTDPR